MKPQINYLIHSQIDKTKWDTCLLNARNGILYALSGYLDIVSPNWSAIIEETENQYTHIFPLPFVQLFGFKILRQPFFAQQLGIVTTEKIVSTHFVRFVEQFFLKQAYISPYQFNTQNLNLPFFQNKSFQVQTFYTHHLVLNQKYAEIIANMSADRRKNLKIAYKTDWKLEESTDIEPLIQMFVKTAAQKIQGGVSAHAYDLLRKIYLFLTDQKIGKLYYSVLPNGERTAGVLLAFWNRTIIYLFNANAERNAKRNGRLWILDQVFRQYAESNWIFDFESPEIPEIAYFYRSFGAREMPYSQLIYNNLPFGIEILRQAKKYLYKTYKIFT